MNLLPPNHVTRLIRTSLLCLVLCMASIIGWGQCPPNIGFEKGSFENWEFTKGLIDRSGNVMVNPTQPDPQNHVLLSSALNGKEMDPYGQFPVVSPNGSGYSVRLGMAAGGADAHGMSYTFTVPKTDGDFSIIYNYAVVLENPEHQPQEQPLFSVKVFNVTDNEYVDCGSFQFVASANLPGFTLSTAGRPNVYYKDWAPITLKLPGFTDKVLRLEFTVNDCALGGHFGYAYLDINENCTTPITGNILCDGLSNLTLTAPYGFQGYRWFSEDFSKELGIKNTLKLIPAPPPGTRLALEITPYPNQGCLDTLYTTIEKSSAVLNLLVKASDEACLDPGFNLSSPDITQGSTPGITLNYFTDEDESQFVSNPKQVLQTGIYYIKATNTAGCTDTKPFNLLVYRNPDLKIKASIEECIPNTINLQDPSITAGNASGLVYTYWRDREATIPASNTTAISQSGIYFLKATDANGCSAIDDIDISITAPPVTVVNDLTACGQLSLLYAKPAEGSDLGATVSYWRDANSVTSIPSDYTFTSTTDYFVKVTSAFGCSVVRPAKVTIHPLPDFTVTDPPTVRIPQTIDLRSTVLLSSHWNYSYWADTLATQPLNHPERIIQSGTYFIKATNQFNCSTILPAHISIEDALIRPSNIFSPNGDGINDTWVIPLIDYYPESSIEIFTRNGQSVYRSKGYVPVWDGRSNNGTIVPVGVYYYLIKQKPGLKPISGTVTVIY